MGQTIEVATQASLRRLRYRVVFGLYVCALLWLILFKLSTDIAGVIARHGARTLNLVPVRDQLRGSWHDAIRQRRRVRAVRAVAPACSTSVSSRARRLLVVPALSAVLRVRY